MSDSLADSAATYQLWMHVDSELTLAVGALGHCRFPPGWYAYTGSARRGLRARLRRHSHPAAQKRLRWHADYLLACPQVTVHYLALFAEPECAVNQALTGELPCPGFGASDCRAGCGGHLRYLGPEFDLQSLAPAP
jgi:Uri superfamily endonuclease